jgi:hypothetical protein
MKKKINVKLSTNAIEKAIKKLQEYRNALEEAGEQAVNKLSELGLEEIQKNYNDTIYTDGNEDVSFFQTGTQKNRKIGVTGTQVLYNEFGTGTEGEQSPHPEKKGFGLNPYNSGKTIRKNNKPESSATQNGIPEGGLYWTYTKNGQKHYTQGIPAGKQVYNAAKVLQKEKNEITKKVIGDALSKL